MKLLRNIRYALCHLYVDPYLKKWKSSHENDENGTYVVSHRYEQIDNIYDLYWYVHDAKHHHDDPMRKHTVTLYDRVTVDKVIEAIRKMEETELKEVINDFTGR